MTSNQATLTRQPNEQTQDATLAQRWAEQYADEFVYLIDEPKDDALSDEDGRTARWYRYAGPPTKSGQCIREVHSCRVEAAVLQLLMKLQKNGEPVVVSPRSVRSITYLASRFQMAEGDK